jgi:proteasome lid subunit RPN8/RPN11
LLHLRDAGPTEIGGFALTRPEDLLLVENIILVHQVATATHVEFDDASVADFFDAQVDAGHTPESFARIWVHTHPGSSPEPSGTDERTFSRVFGGCEWAVMFILARGGQTFARLRYNVGPGADIELAVDVDYARPFSGSDEATWQREYDTFVRAKPTEPSSDPLPMLGPANNRLDDSWYEVWDEYVNQFHSTPEMSHVDYDDF